MASDKNLVVERTPARRTGRLARLNHRDEEDSMFLHLISMFFCLLFPFHWDHISYYIAISL